MFGTIVNVIGIVLASLLGILFRGKISNKYSSIIFDGIGICVIMIGIINVLKIQTPLLMIISVVMGSIIGQFLDIEGRLDKLSTFLMKKFAKDEVDGEASKSNFSKGFITATLLFCVGSMSIVGPIQSSLTGDNTTLFSKTVLDTVSSLMLSSTFGIGVIFSAVPVLLYQGGIALGASSLTYLMTSPNAIADISAVGGILIIGIGLNILKIRKDPILIGNMLPAVFIPIIYYTVVEVLKFI